MRSDGGSRIGGGVWAVLALGLAIGCAAQPYKTGANIDTDYDFSHVKKLAFAKVPPRPLSSENGKILRAALSEAFTARGFEMVEPDQADLWVSYDIGVMSSTATSWGDQSTLGSGRIIVRGIDPTTQHEVFYGWAEARLQRQPDPERRIRAAVEALFENRIRSRNAS